MTHLRKLMLEELERRNYSQSTVRTYLMTIEDFARYFHQPPDALGPEHIREYQAYLFRERKLAANTVNQRVGALGFSSSRRSRKLGALTKLRTRRESSGCRRYSVRKKSGG